MARWTPVVSLSLSDRPIGQGLRHRPRQRPKAHRRPSPSRMSPPIADAANGRMERREARNVRVKTKGKKRKRREARPRRANLVTRGERLGPRRENKGRTMGDGPTGRGTRDSHESRRREGGEGHLSPYVRGRTGGRTRTGSRLHPSSDPAIGGEWFDTLFGRMEARSTFHSDQDDASLVSLPSLLKR